MPTPPLPPWFTGTGRYSFPVILSPEEDGGWSVRSATIVGAVSQGDCIADALTNIAEALQGVIASYRAHGQQPQRYAEPQTAEAWELERSVMVEVI